MIKNFIKTTIALLLISPINSAFAVPIITWDSADGGNDHWYETILSVGVSWSEAKIIADAKGGHLVSITSQQEQDFIRDNILVENSTTALEAFAFWTGGYATNTDLANLIAGGAPGWAWDSGEAWGFDNGLGSSADGNGRDNIITGNVISGTMPPFTPEYIDQLASYMRISAYEWNGSVAGSWSDLHESGTMQTMEINYITGEIITPMKTTNRTAGFIIEYTSQPAVVTEPSILAILGLGLIGIATRRFKKPV